MEEVVMSDTVLAALITGAATLIAGLIGGALAGYFARRRHNQTIAQTARENAQDREDEAQRREDEALERAQRREDEAQRREDEARRQAEQAHRREAVAYLKSIAEAIRRMREKLAKSEIPYDDGHEFIGLLLLDEGNFYEGLLRPYLGPKTQPQLKKLLGIHMRTVGPDNVLEEGGKVDPETLRNLLADMQRVEGDVRVQAGSISPTESRAN
jgi:hypothetical protein